MAGRIRNAARTVAWVSPLLLLTACQVMVQKSPDACDDAAEVEVREPLLSRSQSMMAMARDLDDLERHIDRFGSVTAKTPDVWGQARLTRYREEIEKLLEPEKDNFKLYLNGQIARSDQSFLASATALSLAANPKAAVAQTLAPSSSTTEEKTEYLTPPLTPKSRTTTEKEFDSKGNVTKETKTEDTVASAASAPTPPAPPEAPKAKDAADATKLVSDPDAVKAISRTEARKVTMVGLGAGNLENKIGLEPVEYLNQKKRYLEYLSQLRRNNEGDDTADSPGYALNLMRIPVSVLPGKRTDSGHGAEITFTIDPVYGDELLPSTFRTLLTNDLVRLFGFPLTKFLSDKESRDLLADPLMRLATRDLDGFREVVAKLVHPDQFVKLAREKLGVELQKALDIEGIAAELAKARVAKEVLLKGKEEELVQNAILPKGKSPQDFRQRLQQYEFKVETGSGSDKNLKFSTLDGVSTFAVAAIDEPTRKVVEQAKAADTSVEAWSAKLVPLNAKLTKLTGSLTSVRVPFATGSRNRQPIPSSQFFEVYGSAFPFEVAYRANQALGEEIKNRGYAHLPDVQAFLKTEIDAAFRFLAHDSEKAFWDRFCSENMSHLVHSRNGVQLKNERGAFRDMFMRVAESHGQTDPERQGEFSSTAALAWAMLVDAALLNDRLMQDMKETAGAKQIALPCDRWQQFYLPNPPPDARAAFAQYVKTRWPIHVFALDPETNDQNIADSLSVRREFQMALSIAFTGGQINMNQFNKFVRRLEAEYETVALNRTQIGFSHGDNTFGWRFLPRFQTPATRGNLVTIAQDQLFGLPSQGHLLHERRLEAGPRECTALVIMPSFVSNVTVDAASNWFRLATSKVRLFNHSQALQMSRTVQAIRTDGCGVKDADKYRDIDHRLLLARAEQLSARLPLQTMSAQVPTNDNLSGFELFVNGSSSLAPQLYGWYGAPGIAEGKDTTLFLAGDHFSVTQTRVLAGNQPVTDKQMISRQVMQVKIPAAAIPRGDKLVQINVATPYGVSQELLVKVIPAKADAPAVATAAAPTTAAVVYDKKGRGDGTYLLDNPRTAGAAVAWLQWPDGNPTARVNAELTFKVAGCTLIAKLDKLDTHGKLVPLKKAQLDEVAKQVFDGLNQLSPSTDNTNPLAAGLTTDSVRLIPLGDDGKPDPAKAAASTTQLGLTFSCRVPVPEQPKPGDVKPAAAQAVDRIPKADEPKGAEAPLPVLPPVVK